MTYGEILGWYVNPDDALCAEHAPTAWAGGDYSTWNGFQGWESPAAITQDDESDSVTHCMTCGEVIPHRLTLEGYESISEALSNALDGNMGAAIERWMDEYGEHVPIPAHHDEYLGQFIAGYCHAMLWANLSDVRDTEGNGHDTRPEAWQTADGWQLAAFDAESQAEITRECEDFVRANWRDLAELAGTDYGWGDNGSPDPACVAASAGHDFALTRNGHGAGFWDRGLGDLGDRLTRAARAYGSSTAEFDSEDPSVPVTLI